MIVTEYKTTKVISLYWDDLSSPAKERLTEILGDNGNYDVFPLAEIEIEKENETDGICICRSVRRADGS